MPSRDDNVIKLTQDLVRVPSITPIDPQDYQAAQATLDILQDYAHQSGAVSYRLPAAGGHAKWDYQVDNLYVEWTCGEPRRHIVFLGHTDVVKPGTDAAWSAAPFSAMVKDGYIWGRGTTDMKGAVAAFFCAIEDALSSLRDIRVSAVITTDEEWAAINGTRHVLAWMKERGYAPDAFIVGEPGSRDRLGSHVKVGRRGSLVGRLVVKGVQGHAAYPEAFINPNRGLSLAMSLLQQIKWDDAHPAMPATNFEPVAFQSGDFNASAVIPGEAQALWNIRFTPQQTPSGLLARLQDTLHNPPQWVMQHPDYGMLKTVTVIGNVDTASQPYISTPAGLADSACAAIHDVMGYKPVQDCAGGTTDGRFVPPVFPQAEIIEMGPPERGGLQADGEQPVDYLEKGGMHQVDERIAISDLVNLTAIYHATLVRYAARVK